MDLEATDLQTIHAVSTQVLIEQERMQMQTSNLIGIKVPCPTGPKPLV